MNVRCLHFLSCAACLLLSIAPLVRAQNASVPVATTSEEAETSDLAVGKVRQALAAERTLITTHPNDPSNYVALAYTLTDAGINGQARQEVLKATKVAPNSAFAFNAQAWVHHHNLIGVDYGRGFDYDASLTSYRKAIDLDPNDLDLRQSLANLLEFNRNGIHYAPDSRLAEAIEIYRYVKAHQATVATEVEDNLIIDLFYAGMFREVLFELSNVPKSPVRDGVAAAALAASQGVPAAVAFANQIGGDEQKKKDALSFAAEGLWNMRLYPQAAEILTASLPDTANSKALIGKIQIFRNLRPYKGADLPSTDPRSPVQRLIVSGITNTLTGDVIGECVSRHAFSSEADWKRAITQMNPIAGRFRTLSRETGLPQVVIQDIVLGTIKFSTVPSDEPGARVLVQFPGLLPQNFFVLSEGGSFKVVASDRSLGELGTEALYLLHGGQEAEAKALLDWKRDLVQKDGSDDPLGGLLFARLWTAGKSKGPQSIELAAASFLSDKSALLALLPSVVTARSSTSLDADRDNLDLLIASLYIHTGDGLNASSVAQQLLKQHPNSGIAVDLAGRAYGLQKKWADWRSLLEAHLRDRPNDRGLLLQSAAEAEAEGDFARARSSYRTILDSGHASAEDYNTYAWLSLFEASVDDEALAAAQQANLLSKESSFGDLHTLACLDAARGRTAEARQLLLQAMSTGGLEEPNSSIWYGFGRIYEQYGVTDAAIDAYKHVEAPEGIMGSTDTFVLAQSRLKALHAM